MARPTLDPNRLTVKVQLLVSDVVEEYLILATGHSETVNGYIRALIAQDMEAHPQMQREAYQRVTFCSSTVIQIGERT